MAEGLIRGILGEENEKPEVDAPVTPAGAEFTPVLHDVNHQLMRPRAWGESPE
jgi:hypothetical protein